MRSSRTARTEELRRFACEAFIGNGMKHLTEQAANTEAELDDRVGRRAAPLPVGAAPR